MLYRLDFREEQGKVGRFRRKNTYNNKKNGGLKPTLRFLNAIRNTQYSSRVELLGGFFEDFISGDGCDAVFGVFAFYF
jgi:hypothetical protein